MPELANIGQQRLVALVHDVRIREPELVEFGDEIAVEVRSFGAFVDSPYRRAGGQADRGAVRADLLGDRRGDLDGEAGAVLDGAAIFVRARVGARREELLDEIGVRAVNLDAVGAGLDR